MYVGFCRHINEIFLAYERGDFKLSVNLVQVCFELWKRNNSCWGGAPFDVNDELCIFGTFVEQLNGIQGEIKNSLETDFEYPSQKLTNAIFMYFWNIIFDKLRRKSL